MKKLYFLLVFVKQNRWFWWMGGLQVGVGACEGQCGTYLISIIHETLTLKKKKEKLIIALT